MPLQATSGAASYDAFGGGVAAAPNYIEEVFSTFLYTGTNATQTITNGIDLSGKGGLVWTKARNLGEQHQLIDSARGYRYTLASNSTNANFDFGANIITPSSTGFTLSSSSRVNQDAINYASWTFREQSKFFDIVTYTGNSASSRAITHNLGSAPGCIIVKAYDGLGYNWAVYHRGLNGGVNPENYLLFLNDTMATAGPSSAFWGGAAPTSTTFSVGNYQNTNQSGNNYVAYLFAHDAGGFGLTGTDNVISCGSYTGNGTSVGPTVTLGWEPQWLLIKRATGGTESWYIFDNMRGMPVGSADQYLMPNNSSEEFSFDGVTPTATGFNAASSFNATNASGSTYIYIAIRRGPMKVPTTGTSVFAPLARTGNGTVTNITGLGFAPDLGITRSRQFYGASFWDKLRGPTKRLFSFAASSEETQDSGLIAFGNTGVTLGIDTVGTCNTDTWTFINYFFQRAPGFFDVVCFTGTASTNQRINHNLSVPPELIILKNRVTSGYGWYVYSGNINSYLILEGTAASSGLPGVWGNSSPTITDFGVDSPSIVNNGSAAVAYLFASCPGVSKVFSYTGNGSSQTINCGFTGGARFVMVKRTDSTGNWMVVDTARGLVSAGDPTLYLNSTAAEVTGVDWIDPDNSGFIVNQEGTMNANVSSATYIGLAIA